MNNSIFSRIKNFFTRPIDKFRALPKGFSLMLEFFSFILVIMIMTVGAYFLNTSLGTYLNSSINTNKLENDWNSIKIIIDQNMDKSYLLSECIMDTIYIKLKDNPNKKNFKEDIQVIMQGIKSNEVKRNSYVNNVFIISDSNIIYNANNMNDSRTLYELESSFYNKKLASDSIAGVLNKSKKTLFWESSVDKVINHVYIESCNLDLVKGIYMKEGLIGLKGYDFISSYRIFDKKYSDISLFKNFNNSTMDLMVTFNLYDYIKSYNISQYDDNTHFATYVNQKINERMAVFIFIIITIVFMMITFMIRVHRILSKYTRELKLSFVRDIEEYDNL